MYNRRRLKKVFLEHFAELGNLTAAARATGVSRGVVYKWKDEDEAFAAAFGEADVAATEVLEAEARRRAVEGNPHTKSWYDRSGLLVAQETEITYSDTLLIFLLKARDPRKYRERVQLQHADANGEVLDLASLVRAARAVTEDQA
jgi:hypothetical protein